MIRPPDRDRQAALIEALAELVERHGAASLMFPPLVPSPEWFPDLWTPDIQGVRRLTRRLLSYADLAHVEADVVVWSEVPLELRRRSGALRNDGAVALFLGFDGQVATFAVESATIEDPDVVAAALAHEVAHAWRRIHGERVEDERTEEELTDLTTVFLGFGILTTNAAYRFRKSGGYGYTQWSHETLGYLGPGTLSFLLAVQAVARGSGARERRRIRRLLEVSQADAFATAVEALNPEATVLQRRLGGPSSNERPRPLVLPDVPPPPPRVTVQPDPGRRWNRGNPVFRVSRSRVGPLLGRPLLALAPSGAMGVVAGSALGIEPTLAFWGALAIGAGLGLWSGIRALRHLHDFCSERHCEGQIPPGALTCPECGGLVSGKIASIAEHMGAVEALAERQHAARTAIIRRSK